MIQNTAVETAYEFLKQHDPGLADLLCNNMKGAEKNLRIANDRMRERDAEYNASIWQQLTRDRIDVLRMFDRVIEDAETLWYVRENDIINAAEAIDEKINLRKEHEIEEGNFVHYIVELDTNVRKTKYGVPIIYSTIEAAEFDYHDEYDTVISIAEYNRRYGSFMED